MRRILLSLVCVTWASVLMNGQPKAVVEMADPRDPGQARCQEAAESNEETQARFTSLPMMASALTSGHISRPLRIPYPGDRSKYKWRYFLPKQLESMRSRKRMD